jgi:hypothetical protein
MEDVIGRTFSIKKGNENGCTQNIGGNVRRKETTRKTSNIKVGE